MNFRWLNEIYHALDTPELAYNARDHKRRLIGDTQATDSHTHAYCARPEHPLYLRPHAAMRQLGHGACRRLRTQPPPTTLGRESRSCMHKLRHTAVLGRYAPTAPRQQAATLSLALSSHACTCTNSRHTAPSGQLRRGGWREYSTCERLTSARGRGPVGNFSSVK